MKKLLSIVLVVLFTFAMVATAFAAPTFSDVPAKHWAYDAVAKLAKAGLIEGYGDGTFRGDKSMNRYEFAILTVKAIDRFDKADQQQKQLIDKLSAEFAAELNRIGARVAKVEAKTNTWMSGETRMRYVSDDPAAGTSTKLAGHQKFDFRQRVNFFGNINDNMSFRGRLATSGHAIAGDTSTATEPGTEIDLDLMNVTMKNALGLDSIRLGRTPLDFYTHGLIGKPMNIDGVTLKETFGDVKFTGFTGINKYSASTTADSSGLTTAELAFKPAKNLGLKLGYYWSDSTGSTGPGGTLNTASGSFNSSKGLSVGFNTKIGDYTLLFDYVSSKLANASANLPKNPDGWAVELTNSKKPPVFFPAVNLVNPAMKGTDAWMVSYRSVDPGALPSGGFDTTAVGNVAGFNSYTKGTDNVNVLYLAYQTVIAKNVVWGLEYQDFKFKNRALTGLSSDKLNRAIQTKIEFFY